MGRGISRVTISRDTPFAQKRFAEEAHLTDLQFLSDYKEGTFGRSTGLLVTGYLNGNHFVRKSKLLISGDALWEDDLPTITMRVEGSLVFLTFWIPLKSLNLLM